MSEATPQPTGAPSHPEHTDASDRRDRSALVSCRLGAETCRDVEQALSREWLETDGRGGFATSTILDCPTRRYHGLLTASLGDDVGRHLFLTRYDTAVVAPGAEPDGSDLRADLGLACYRGGVLAPRADHIVTGFRRAPHPITTFQAGPLQIRREVLMPKGRPVILVRYEVLGAAGPVTLEARPLLACRQVDALRQRHDDLDERVHVDASGFAVRPEPALPEIHFRTGGVDPAAVQFEESPCWYEGIELRADLDRGYDGHEDNWCPGVLRIELHPDAPSVVLAASLDAPIDDPADLWDRVLRLRDSAVRHSAEQVGDAEGTPLSTRARIAATADDFFGVTERGRLGICAGFPWFGEWGRDVFIALPGLTLPRGRLAQCARVLLGALPFLRGGLLPNIYGSDPDDSHYGSVDAALWYARAVGLFADHGGSPEALREQLFPALCAIAEAYGSGQGEVAALGVRPTDDGLFEAGSPELNATWMDAQTHEGPVTPREGVAVELAALYCELLARCAEFAERFDDPTGAARWQARADRAATAFLQRLWLDAPAPAGQFLADRHHRGAPVAEVRPNMVMAAALRLSPLDTAQRLAVVERVERDLLTPRGLRTLAPDDPAYRGVYRGDGYTRDNAYHQGTVWPWPLGFYVEACLRARGAADAPRLRALLDGFAPHLDEAGLDHVSEVFDGDAPHRPGGTIAQAWSSAELLRAWDLLDRAEAATPPASPSPQDPTR